MKPNQTYAYTRQAKVALDTQVLAQCYLPILGPDAFGLCHYLFAQFDNGVGEYRLSHLLNHLNMGIDRLEQSLDRLTALGLLKIFQEDEDYRFVLQPTLSLSRFLKHPLLSSLLAQKIGEPALEEMRQQEKPKGQDISKRFSEVFEMDGQTLAQARPSSPRSSFDIEAFETMMQREGYTFMDRAADTVALYHMAEQTGQSWMELYQLAKKTAVGQEFSMKRLAHRLELGSAEKTTTVATPLTPQEKAVVREAKAHSALEFLGICKAARHAQIIASEQRLLQDLAALGLLDEVINVVVLYTLNRVDSANLNEKYAKKVANDFSYKGVHSAEEAVLALRELLAKGAVASNGSKTNKPKQSNVPEWSKTEVQTEFTAEEEAQMEALYQQMLEDEQKGGD